MQAYQNLLQKVIEEGVWQDNRTNLSAKFIPSAAITHDLRDGFPTLTTKKLYFRQSIAEICGFLRGFQSASDFRKLGCRFWNSDANENKTWLSSPWRKGEDDLGCVYGATWRDREVTMLARSQREADALLDEGFEKVGELPNAEIAVFTKHQDQLRECVDKIINKPQDRRIIMHAWFPELFPRMALPPCHVLYEFVPDEHHKVLHMTCVQRSCDLLLGVPMNIFGGSLLLSIVAKACGYAAGQFSHQMTNVHLYENQLDAATTQMERCPLPLPVLEIAKSISDIDTDSAMRFIETLDPADVSLIGYEHHEPLPKVEMAQEKNNQQE